MNRHDRDTLFTTLIACCLAVLVLHACPAKASQSMCTQYNNNRFSCQNYDDNGTYQGLTEYQRNGNSSTFNSTNMNDGYGDNNETN